MERQVTVQKTEEGYRIFVDGAPVLDLTEEQELELRVKIDALRYEQELGEFI